MKTPTRIKQVVSDLIEVADRAGALESLPVPAQATLHARLEDAFSRGRVDLVRQHLLAHAPDGKSQRQLTTLLDSTLASLGVDPAEAKRSWGVALDGVAGFALPSTPPRISPARDAFRGIRMALGTHTARVMRRLSARQARLEISLTRARDADAPVDALRALAAKVDLGQTTDAFLMGLICAFAEHGAWADLLHVYSSAPTEFKTYPIPRRARALALLQSGDTTGARKVLEKLVRHGETTNVVHGLLGKAYTTLFRDGGQPQLLDKAIEHYKKGFDADRAEIYPGLCMPALLEMKADATSRAEASRFAAVVETLALSRISYGERHYWDHAATVTMALVRDDGPAVQRYMAQLERCSAEPWMIDSTRQHIDLLREARAANGGSTTQIDAVITALEVWTPPKPVEFAHRKSASPALSRLLDHAYRFGGRSSKRLAGNYHLDGIAHDVRVSPADVEYFTRIVEGSALDAITDPMKASNAMDEIVRAHFGTAEMETLVSEAHVHFDQVMPLLAKYMGASRASSQTNVAADWINKLADCRQHAPAKLLLFESWKRIQTRRLMARIETASTKGDTPTRTAAESELAKLSAWEMRIIDADIVERESSESLEEHTLTLLVHRVPTALGEEMTELDAVHLADSFYHAEHKLASGPVQVVADEDRIHMDIPGPSASGVAVKLVSTPYSYDRADKSVDFGQLKFRGIEVATPGWEHEVPIDGLDLGYLHEFVATGAS